MITLRCILMFNSTSRFIIRIVFNVSKSPVGSSSSNKSGLRFISLAYFHLFASPRAIETRCCSPPLSCEG